MRVKEFGKSMLHVGVCFQMPRCKLIFVLVSINSILHVPILLNRLSYMYLYKRYVCV